MSIGIARIGRTIGMCALALSLLGGCASWFNPDRWGGTENDPDAQRKAQDPYHYDPKWSNPDVFADYRNIPDHQPKGILDALFSPDKSDNSGNGGSGIGVNSFLWHASLDTVSFMPLASADPFGGTIITDWYSPPETPIERFKINIFILGRDLRADGVRARVFRQDKGPNGQWADAAVDQTTGTGIENAILARARQIRMSSVAK